LATLVACGFEIDAMNFAGTALFDDRIDADFVR
jgi:hypothetical protein